jgi:hypothetical protein
VGACDDAGVAPNVGSVAPPPEHAHSNAVSPKAPSAIVRLFTMAFITAPWRKRRKCSTQRARSGHMYPPCTSPQKASPHYLPRALQACDSRLRNRTACLERGPAPN